jgi:PLP dependent protein
LEIASNISIIKDYIKEAAERSRRDPHSIKVVAVTKTVSVERIRKAIQLGWTDLGENRVQEAQSKILQFNQPSCKGKEETPRLSWHLIGHLQTNKVKTAVQLFDLIHSVDTLHLAQEISRCAKNEGRVMPVLVQVNVSQEVSKYGCSVQDAEQLIREMASLEHLSVQGLMTVPPLAENPEQSRPYFRRLKKLYDHLSSWDLPSVRMETLSMGMSQDYAVAIEEGANLVRIGRALFGER